MPTGRSGPSPILKNIKQIFHLIRSTVLFPLMIYIIGLICGYLSALARYNEKINVLIVEKTALEEQLATARGELDSIYFRLEQDKESGVPYDKP